MPVSFVTINSQQKHLSRFLCLAFIVLLLRHVPGGALKRLDFGGPSLGEGDLKSNMGGLKNKVC